MDLFGVSQSVDSANREESSCSILCSVLSRDPVPLLLWNKISLDHPSISLSGESRYLTSLWVSGNEKPMEELCRAENIVPHHQIIKEKIRAALKHLNFREQHALIQFWFPRVVGKHQLLTTVDQPFGLGAVTEELCFYRRESERNAYFVDEDHEEDDISAPARVFRQKKAEWTSDLANYKSNDFPLQESAIHSNLRGYLALPVFDSTAGGLCVGVLEILTSSKYTGCTYEVQQVHSALETQYLTCPQVLGYPASYVVSEVRQTEWDIIFNSLKKVCDTHCSTLAQTWAVSPSTTFVSHNKIIEKSCGSFNTRCVGKVCLSTSSLPFYVPDLSKWPYMEASRERHHGNSEGIVGRAFVSRGSCFCGDVTQLNEEDYPLVHHARMNKLTGCFVTFLHSVERNNDYLLEFFLDMKDGSYLVPDVVQTLKQLFGVGSGFELGDMSSIQEVGPPTDLSDTESVVTDMDLDTVTMQDTVTVQVTFEGNITEFEFPILSGLLILENEVAQRFGLEGKCLRLKYRDEEDDLISIFWDDDLALATLGINSISLICYVTDLANQ